MHFEVFVVCLKALVCLSAICVVCRVVLVSSKAQSVCRGHRYELKSKLTMRKRWRRRR